LKQQGNEYFKGNRYREAIGFYNQGVDAKPTDNAILEALLLNRAACNLELGERKESYCKEPCPPDRHLGNYGRALGDCSKVLTTNPKSSKAYYRSGQALMRLGKLTEALDCCTRCLAYDPTNEGIGMLVEKVKNLKLEQDERDRKMEEQRRKEETSKMALKKAFWVGFVAMFRPNAKSLSTNE
jgi:small subunit ribosomal protein S7e